MLKKFRNKIICGEASKLLQEMPDNCIDLVVSSPPYDCYSDDTEVLTYSGWCLMKDVKLGEKVLTLNPHTKEVYWESVVNKFIYNYNGSLVQFKNESIDLLVTPNHNMYVEYKDGSPTRERKPFIFKNCLKSSYLKKAESIKSADLLRMRDFIWNGNNKNYFTLPKMSIVYNKQQVDYSEIKIKMNYWCAFFGLWIAEGSVRGSKGGNKKNYEISLKQKNNIAVIRRIFKNLPFDYKEYIDRRGITRFSITNYQLWYYLKQFGNSHTKYIPKDMMELNTKYLKVLMYYYLFGDGHQKKGGYFFNKFTDSRSVSTELNNCLMEIAVKLGTVSRINGDRCVYPKRSYIRLGDARCFLNYKGKVCCLEVKQNNIIFVRRKGKCCFAGNSLRDYNGYVFNFKEIAQELARVLKKGGVIVWVVGDQVIRGSESGESFRQALYFKEIGLWLHDTMIYAKKGMSYPESVRYYQAFEYMFVVSKGKPKTINLIKDRKNNPVYMNGVQNRGGRQKDGSTNMKVKRQQYKEYGVRYNIWHYDVGYMKTTQDRYAYDHPAMFPEALAHDHIVSWSNPGDVVLDIFAGSGTTLKMAKLLKRVYIGFDISSEYCRIAKKRIAFKGDYDV